MTTAEIIKEISQLSEDEQIAISRQVDEIINERSARKYFKRYTKEELAQLLKESHEQSRKGQTVSAYQSLANIREKYGIPA